MPTRTVKFSYNGYEPSFPVSKYSRTRSYDKTTFTMQFLINSADENALKTDVEAAIASLTAWNKDLVITQGSSTVTYSHSSNTGFLARPTVTKVGSPFDSCRSQLLQFSVDITMPADASSFGGRRQSNVSIDREPNEGYIVTISADYTAVSSNAVQANIISNFLTYANTEMAAVASALGITNYEVIEKVSFSREGEDKVGTARIRYAEVLYDEVTSGQSTDVVMVSFNVSVDAMPLGIGILSGGGAGNIAVQDAPSPPGRSGRTSVGGRGGPQTQDFIPGSKASPPSLGDVPPVKFSAAYFGIVPKSASVNEQELYISKVEAYMQAKLLTVAGLGSPHTNIYVQSRRPEFNPHKRIISVSWSGLILGPNNIETYSEVLTLTNNNNIIMEKVRDGQDDTHSVFYLGRSLSGVHTVSVVSYEKLIGSPSGGLSGGWIRLGDTTTLGPHELVAIKESKVATSKRKIYYTARRYLTSFLTNYAYAVASRGVVQGGTGGGGRTVPREAAKEPV